MCFRGSWIGPTWCGEGSFSPTVFLTVVKMWGEKCNRCEGRKWILPSWFQFSPPLWIRQCLQSYVQLSDAFHSQIWIFVSFLIQRNMIFMIIISVWLWTEPNSVWFIIEKKSSVQSYFIKFGRILLYISLIISYTLNDSTHKLTHEWRIKQRLLHVWILIVNTLRRICRSKNVQATGSMHTAYLIRFVFSMYIIYFVILSFSD